MRNELLVYYERELGFIRKLAMEFAEKYPDVAGALLLEPTKSSQDPHVERLIEAFAMLTARVHLRLDDDFPEVTEALLGALYPHYLAPIPSMTIVQLALDPEQAKTSEGVLVDRHAMMRARPVNDVRCRFRTCYPVRLWPIEVSGVELVSVGELEGEVPSDVHSALRIRLRPTVDDPISAMGIRSLRFFLHAGPGTLHGLYELLFRNPRGLLVRKGESGPARLLGPDRIVPVGFAADEGMLDYPPESFLGYRLLQEYFAFPEKFLFAEFQGLDTVPVGEDAGPLEICVLLREPLNAISLRVSSDNLKLHCAPAINLFPHTADPIRLDQRQVEYPVVPDVRASRAYEVFRVTGVTGSTPGTADVRRLEPFYAIRHGSAGADEASFWHAVRRPAIRKEDEGTDVLLRVVDRSFNPLRPAADILNVTTLCTNRDLPARLRIGDQEDDFQMDGRPEIKRVRCLTKPTRTLRAPQRGETRWRLVSHLSLNHLSLTEGSRTDGHSRSLDALREILKLYEFGDTPSARQRIAGIVELRSRRVMRRVGRGGGPGFARGFEIELEFDEEKFTGSGALLFASVLERFLGLYTSVNSFTQTVAISRQRGGILKRWPPRAGAIQLL